MRRVLALLVAFGIGAAAMTACDSFQDAGGQDAGGNGADASATDATTTDGSSTEAGPPFCGASVATASSHFTDGIFILGFKEDTTNGGDVDWSTTEGNGANGALVATLVNVGGAQAQIESTIPVGKATRVRVEFAMKVKAATAGAAVAVGCTLQLFSALDDGGAAFVAILFEAIDNQLVFVRQMNVGGADRTPVANLPNDVWKVLRLEMTDIGTPNIGYRAFVGGEQVPTGAASVSLLGKPDHFRVKCGIDEGEAPATVLMDDLDFVTCEAP